MTFKSDASPTDSQTTNRRILIVDDTPENLTILAKVLRQSGYEVVTALNGDRAFQVAVRTPPDLVLMDIWMPDIDGYAVAERFKEDARLRNIPIIFISAAIDTEIKVRAFKSGGVDYISKPFEADEVLARVGLHLALRTVEDELERRLAERTRQLAASELKYRSLVEALYGDYFFYTKSADNQFTYVSQSVTAVLGYTPEDFLAHTPEILFSAESNETFHGNFFGAHTRSSRQLEASHQDGSVRHLEVSEFPVSNDQGVVVAIEGIAHDITEDRRIQHELQQTKEAAEAGSKAKSAFLAMISHELRTPLNGILGTVDLINNAPTLDKKIEYIDVLVSSARFLYSILNTVLDMSKMEAGTFSLGLVQFSLPQVANEVFVMTEERAREKNLPFHLTIDDNLVAPVIGDPIRVMQVIQSLVENAIKFTESGSIHLRVSRRDWAGSPSVALVEVIDTGIGIDARFYDRLFRPFSQIDMSLARQFGGTGLGLATARHLIELMGGEIDFDSNPGHGSRFWFTLRLH